MKKSGAINPNLWRSKKYMILYHGSNVIVQEPQILENGFYKDFGYGFGSHPNC